jgi:hypothetical protein
LGAGGQRRDQAGAGQSKGCSAPAAVTNEVGFEVQGQRAGRGQSLVEFALVLSVLLLILWGVFDLGRVFYAYITITNAAREGAYYGSMHAEDHAGIIARVVSEAQGSGVTLSAADITVSGSTELGTPISVTVQYEFPLLSSYVLGQQTIGFESHAQMVILSRWD